MFIRSILFSIFCTTLCLAQTKPACMIGFDSNYAMEMEQHGKAWHTIDKQVDPFVSMHNAGCDSFRIRLWTGDEGVNGLKYATETAKRAQQAGLKPYLVIFLSDNWADMVKQPVPDIWKKLNYDDKLKAIETYTARITQYFSDNGIHIDLYEIGNEIDFGICGEFEEEWPKRVSLDYMQKTIWPKMGPIIRAAQRGVKSSNPHAQFMLHLAQWNDAVYCAAFWKQMLKQEVQIDFAGISYFPTSAKPEFRPLSFIQKQIEMLSRAIDRPIIICESGYPSAASFPGQFADWNKPIEGYTLDEPGQAKWIANYIAMARSHPQLAGVFYWSPEWYDNGLWDAFALFDSNGIAKPALQSFATSIPPTTQPAPITTQPTTSNLNIYFGNLHSHTGYSDGVGTPEEAYLYARDVAKIDFLAITEHNHILGGEKALMSDRKALYVGPTSSALIPTANRLNADGKFIAIYGQEFSSMSKGNHVNIFEASDVIDTPNGQYDQLLQWMNKHPDSTNQMPIMQMNHPGLGVKFINRLQYGRDDFGDDAGWIKNMGAATSLIEVVNGEPEKGAKDNRPPQVFDDYYRLYLQFGFHVAPVADQDNHTKTWGTATDARTAIYAPALTRKDLYAAMRARHVYATEDKNLQIRFTVNGHLCGDIIQSPTPLTNLKIEYSITDPDEPIATYTIESFTGIIGGDPVKQIKTTITQNNSSGTIDGLNLTNNQFLYFRILQQSTTNTDTTWTAPVWLKVTGR